MAGTFVINVLSNSGKSGTPYTALACWAPMGKMCPNYLTIFPIDICTSKKNLLKHEGWRRTFGFTSEESSDVLKVCFRVMRINFKASKYRDYLYILKLCLII